VFWRTILLTLVAGCDFTVVFEDDGDCIPWLEDCEDRTDPTVPCEDPNDPRCNETRPDDPCADGSYDCDTGIRDCECGYDETGSCVDCPECFDPLTGRPVECDCDDPAADPDGDGWPNVEDEDDDGDGTPDVRDEDCPCDPNVDRGCDGSNTTGTTTTTGCDPNQGVDCGCRDGNEDTDGDGIRNDYDADDDGDGVLDADDRDPCDPAVW
jgi:hypothetical protein